MSTQSATRSVARGFFFLVLSLSVLASLLAAETTLAFREPDTSMAPAPDYDIRGPLSKGLPLSLAPGPSTAAQANALNALQSFVGDLTVRWSALTGAPSRIYSTSRALTGPSAAPAPDVAANFLASNLALFNLSPQDVSEIRLSRDLVSAQSGVTHLTIQQKVNGIDVFGGAIQVNIDRHGRVLSISGEPIPGVHASVNTQKPVLSPDAAASQAAAHAGVTAVKEFRSAGIVYFPTALGNTRLAWDVTVEDARTPNIYRTLVDAVDGTVLWRENLTKYAHIATHGAVFERDSPIPDSPIGTSTGTIARTDQLFHGGGQVFPPVVGMPLFPHADVHFDWWAGAARTVTTSNNVRAQEDRNGDNAAGTQATDNGVGDFTHPLDLTLDPSTYTLAAITNLFYWNNRIHGIWYRYGFDEASGNFQSNNFGLGGAGGDSVIADAQDNRDGGSLCNANMGTPGDGASPRMQMFQCNIVSPERDGDFDNPVIIHEFHHGLATRLTPGLHGGSQGGGMGEGGGDFQGITVVAEEGDDPNGRYGIGEYLFSFPIRRAPFSIRPGVYPFTYGDIALSAEVHNVGEIWANTLWIGRALLISRYGFVTGTNTVLQLQVDGYKLSPANPDFLDMRDAILQADLVNNGGINQCLLWQAFARMGMGVSASTTGNTDTNPVEAFDTPLACTPRISVNPALVDFGFVPVNPLGGESGVKSLDFNICNVGTTDLFVTNVVLQAPNPAFTIVPPPPDGFPLPISRDFCHTIEVRFNPSTSGLTTATVRIESTDPDDAVITVPSLSGTGAVPAIQVSPSPLTFGNVATNPVGGETGVKDLPLKVRNQGTSNLQVTSIAAVGGNSADFTVLTPVPGFPTIISPDAEFDFQIRCNPSAAGLRSTTIRVTSNSGGVAATTEINADCTGAVPDIAVSGALDFGKLTGNEIKDLAIQTLNTGNSNLSITNVILAGDPAFTLQGPPAVPLILSPDAQAQITVRCDINGPAGIRTATLTIDSNDPDEAAVTVAASCRKGMGP